MCPTIGARASACCLSRTPAHSLLGAAAAACCNCRSSNFGRARGRSSWRVRARRRRRRSRAFAQAESGRRSGTRQFNLCEPLMLWVELSGGTYGVSGCNFWRVLLSIEFSACSHRLLRRLLASLLEDFANDNVDEAACFLACILHL